MRLTSKIWGHLSKQPPKTLLCYGLGFLSALIFLLLVNPLDAAQRFKFALDDIFKDFKLDISVDITKCGVFLWTRENRYQPDKFKILDKETLIGTHFNKSFPVKILIHGFSDGASTLWTRRVKDQYLDLGDHNVFSLDWELLAQSPWYSTAAKNAEYAGFYGSEFVRFLVSPAVGYSWDEIHVIGASLGAQVAGHLGYFADGKIGRITGLDPSGPLFHSAARKARLDRTDAQFVDVIHSAGKWVGNDDIQGHVDFMPNSGRAPQPGCEGVESFDLTCSHFKSWQIFAESIPSDIPGFYALECPDVKSFTSGRCCKDHSRKVVLMGERISHEVRGIYYLVTEAKQPYWKATMAESVNCEEVKFHDGTNEAS